jgi:hypothetical protein
VLASVDRKHIANIEVAKLLVVIDGFGLEGLPKKRGDHSVGCFM